MFERYTDSARRSLFFARAAAIEVGSAVIAPDHLLSAVLRELRKPRTTPNHDWSSVVASVRVDVEPAVKWDAAHKEGDVPFSAATKRVLMYALEEADDLHHWPISPEHLLLGILRCEDQIAERLKREGVTLQHVRLLAAELSRES